MADDEVVFVNVWTAKWSKIVAPQQFSAPGAVRRLNIGALLGKTLPDSAESGGKLIDGIFVDLRSMLKDGATFWSSGPGMISIFYPKMLPQAADLAHSVICSTIERRIRDTIVVPARAAATTAAATATSPTERRVSWEDFQRVVRRAKAKPEQIQTIDISELILGKADPAAHLSKRAWKLVDDIVDEFMGANGYCARQSGNQILLFFPGHSVSLSQMKRKAIISEISASTGAMVAGAEEFTAEGEEEDDLPVARRKPAEDGESAEEIAQLNKAFAALGSSVDIAAQAAEFTAGVAFSAVAVWRAANHLLVGHNIFVQSEVGQMPVDQLDLACLFRAQTDAQESAAAQSPYLVIAQLHWYTLERLATRTKYLELAAKLPEEARRYLVFALHDVPEDLLPARIDDRMRELRPFGRTMSFHSDLDRREFEQIKGLEFHAVGTTLERNTSPERDLILAINGFIAAQAPLQTKTFLHGLNTKSMVIAAIAAGSDYLSGTAIVDAKEGVQGVRAFSISDLYAETAAPSAAPAP